MIIFTLGGDQHHMPVDASIGGVTLEEVVLDNEDFAVLARASNEQLRKWVQNLHCRFIPPKGTR